QNTFRVTNKCEQSSGHLIQTWNAFDGTSCFHHMVASWLLFFSTVTSDASSLLQMTHRWCSSFHDEPLDGVSAGAGYCVFPSGQPASLDSHCTHLSICLCLSGDSHLHFIKV
uniref:Uncharacterized protein n=1 Tax=Scophthalmus maximus TaxID=52904 RepID=A0A8D3EB17_SCOMX